MFTFTAEAVLQGFAKIFLTPNEEGLLPLAPTIYEIGSGLLVFNRMENEEIYLGTNEQRVAAAMGDARKLRPLLIWLRRNARRCHTTAKYDAVARLKQVMFGAAPEDEEPQGAEEAAEDEEPGEAEVEEPEEAAGGMGGEEAAEVEEADEAAEGMGEEEAAEVEEPEGPEEADEGMGEEESAEDEEPEEASEEEAAEDEAAEELYDYEEPEPTNQPTHQPNNQTTEIPANFNHHHAAI